jgi:hypothetical protein
VAKKKNFAIAIHYKLITFVVENFEKNPVLFLLFHYLSAFLAINSKTELPISGFEFDTKMFQPSAERCFSIKKAS